MKLPMKFKLIITMLAMPLIVKGQNSFEAEMANVKRGKKQVYQVKSDGIKYRYDFEEEGIKGIVIVDAAKGKTAILMPDKEYVHYTETSSVLSRENDPVQAVMTLKDRYTEKKAGMEEIAGFNCAKSELSAADQKIFTLWFSEKLNFPLRIEQNLGQDTYMELSGIKMKEMDASAFVVPEYYTEVDERMRPKIPEPPAPEHWNDTESSIPLDKEYQRSDRIHFKVPESGNYIISLKNESAGPAKIIRKTFRDGIELPDDEQGPLKYRTRRLYANESFKNTYIWEAGDAKIVEVHEGKLNIEIYAENR